MIEGKENEDIKKRIGVIIADLRKEKGLTIRDLGKMVGIAHTHIAMIEAGKHSTGIELIDRIATVLGKRLDIV